MSHDTETLTEAEEMYLLGRIAGILMLPADAGAKSTAILELIEASVAAARGDAWDEGEASGARNEHRISDWDRNPYRAVLGPPTAHPHA